MSDMRIDMPDHLTDFVREQAEQGGYGEVGDYVVQLIEIERRKKAQAKLESELLMALQSGPATEMSADDWRHVREEAERRIGSRTT